MPLMIYFAWLLMYGTVNFIFTSKVEDYTHDSVYRTFTRNSTLRKYRIVRMFPMPIVFLASHFLYYFSFHCIAVLLYHSYWLNMLTCFLLLQWAVINGASYYMEWFSKKYEKEL